MIDFTEQEKEFIEATSIHIICWVINNQRLDVSFGMQSDEIAIAIFKRLVEIAHGAGFRVHVSSLDDFHGVWGTKG